MSQNKPVTRKPQVPEIDWSNPMTRKLVFDVPFMEGGGTKVRDLVKKRQLTLTNSPTWSNGLYGKGLTFLEDSSQYAVFNTPVSTVTDNFTMQCVFYFRAQTSPTGEQLYFYNGNDGGGGWGVGVDGRNMHFLFGGKTRVGSGAPGDLDTNGRQFTNSILRRQNGTNQLFRDGHSLNVSSTTAPNTPTNSTQIGGMVGSTSDFVRFADGTVFYARIWERALSDAEIRILGVNPAIIYKQPSFIGAKAAAVVEATRQALTLMGIGS